MRDRYYTPSRSAPSSTSPMSPVPADDSSSNRESVLRSNAMFSMPFMGVLKQEKEHELCSLPLPAGSQKGRHFLFLELPAGLVSYEVHIQLRGGLNDVLHICVILVLRQPWTTHRTGILTTPTEHPCSPLQIQPRVESHCVSPSSYPLIWTWSPGQPAPQCSYCFCPLSPFLMPWWTSALLTLSRWSLTTHPATKQSKFNKKSMKAAGQICATDV